MSDADKKKYGLSGPGGLQIKAKSKFGLQRPVKPVAGSAFDIAGDEEEYDGRERAKAELRRMMAGQEGRAAVAHQQQKALAEDATVFDYDGVYDQMQASKVEQRLLVGRSSDDKKARYIGSILEAHKVREIENEKLFERKMVKEAEAEAHLYKDKEKFLTSAYQRKLESRKEYEEELKRKEAEEARNDVTKRADLSGFYSNLLNHNLAPDERSGAGSTARDKAIAGMQRGSSCTSDLELTSPTVAPEAVSSSVNTDERDTPANNEESRSDSEKRANSSSVGPLVEDSLASAISAATAVELPRVAETPTVVVTTVAHARRNNVDAVTSARERYLARKAQKTSG